MVGSVPNPGFRRPGYCDCPPWRWRFGNEAKAIRRAKRDRMADFTVYRCPGATVWHLALGDADMGPLLQSAHRVVAHAFSRYTSLPYEQVLEALAKVNSSPNKVRKVFTDLREAGLIEHADGLWHQRDRASLERIVRVGWSQYRTEKAGV